VTVEILLLGTGKTTALLPSNLRSYLTGLGIQVDVMDTVRLRVSLFHSLELKLLIL
jgi:uncharacterized protein